MKRSRQRNYWKRTIHNKILALVLVTLGALTLKINSMDGTAFVFTLGFALPLFFAKENWVISKRGD